MTEAVDASTMDGRGVDWFTMGPAMSPEIPDGLYAVRHLWKFRDLFEAHVAIDTRERIREILKPPTK